jgi:hypothetical protein
VYVYSFGAPGHGKGVFDGVGRAIKNKVHSLIKATKTSDDGVPGVDFGYINNVTDVFQAIRHNFENSEHRVRRRAGSNSINHYKFFLYLMDENPIRRPEETFDQLHRILSNYQFTVNNIGIVYMRQCSCWCMQCMSKLMQSTLDWNDTCAIARCVFCEHETTNLYSFRKQSCHKQCGSGVESLRVIKDQRNEIAANLTHGDWMMFESPEPNVQPFWIGRALSKREGNNSCFNKESTTRRKNLMVNLPLDPGKYAVNVQWYNQRDIGSPLE